MKKRTAKLSLSRETVRNLAISRLGQAAGGTFATGTAFTDLCNPGATSGCGSMPTSAGRLGCDNACVDPEPPLVTTGTV